MKPDLTSLYIFFHFGKLVGGLLLIWLELLLSWLADFKSEYQILFCQLLAKYIALGDFIHNTQERGVSSVVEHLSLI